MSSNPFAVHNVFWRKVLDWGVVNVPPLFEPAILLLWSALFYLTAGPRRRAIHQNLRAILPHSSSLLRPFQALRIYWNFAGSINDTQRFALEERTVDWTFVGHEHFRELVDTEGGAIILTAHMGNYDLGAFLFAERMKRQVTIIRAPERDPAAQEFMSESRARIATDEFRVGYNTSSSSLALELVNALQRGEIVAIQGDRITPGISSFPSEFFGLPAAFPTGPFALAMATHVPIYPLFVIKRGIRDYCVLTCPPIRCTRTSRDRNRDLSIAVREWRAVLEEVVRTYWYQWFMFEPIGADQP